MASASKTLSRALRSASAAQTFKTTASRRVAIQRLQRSAHRGYSSEAPKPSNGGSNTYIWGGLAAGIAIGTGAYFALGDSQPPKPFSPQASDYQAVYDAVAKKIIDESDYDDGSYGPVLLRLGWHASGTYDAETKTGGSNGATMRFDPEADHGANAGLAAARNFLLPIKEQFPWITFSDLWTLAAACAIQEMGGPIIPWRPGRTDRDVSFCTPDGRLPDATKEQNHLRAIFGRMGFNDREIVALSGAHAVGRCHPDRSGFDGPWTFSPITLTNDFYKLLLEEKWQWKKWGGPKQYEDKKTKTLMMLPTDMSLIKDKSFMRYVEEYAKDQEVFFKDFSDVVVKLFELGVPFTTQERIQFKKTE
ncbi:probable Cytochrome c peroxidase, mitochondrial [Ramularia collo-cygni]|uniref:Peroxidase n=1 Tax=Ramularia collo-cygni TaxID=112498 RepID=A0A2D3VQX7_9PEZI|nr:probable Cytochrome c peroxidase, mitochondrial [Ramularia collo-cygni]CZT24628.1 probable Cytochrome c peroxidase, mitochondrial [Ramularia collo-cygni]